MHFCLCSGSRWLWLLSLFSSVRKEVRHNTDMMFKRGFTSRKVGIQAVNMGEAPSHCGLQGKQDHLLSPVFPHQGHLSVREQHHPSQWLTVVDSLILWRTHSKTGTLLFSGNLGPWGSVRAHLYIQLENKDSNIRLSIKTVLHTELFKRLEKVKLGFQPGL